MLYFGLMLGILLGSFMTVILMALTKEVSLEKEAGATSYEIIKQHNSSIKTEESMPTSI